MPILIFLALPLVEIAAFILIGQAIGVVPTLLGVVLTGLLGMLVLRYQGAASLRDLRGAMARGELPGRAIADAMMIGLAGLLLLLPGYVTDALALLLLLPPVRGAIYGFLGARMVVVSSNRPYGGPHTPADPERLHRPDVIDLDDEDYRQR